MSRVTFINWLAEGGLPSMSNPLQTGGETEPRLLRIEEAVRAAIARLPDEEQELIRLHHFQGMALAEIARQTGRKAHNVESMHRRIIKKLRRQLTAFVEGEFGLPRPHESCPICQSPQRREIDSLINSRDRSTTWRPVLCRLRQEFGLTIRSVQCLIGHARYHIVETIKTEEAK